MFNQIYDSMDDKFGSMEERMDQMYQMFSQNQPNQQNQGQRFNNGQMQNRFNPNQGRFNRGQGQDQNFGQKRNGQNGQNRNGGNNREVFSTYCKRYRHQVGNCLALKAELKRRGYKISNGTNGFNGGQRNNPGRGGFNNRGGRNGFQNRNGGRQNIQDRFNCMNEDEYEDEYENEMDDDDLFICCLSEFQENTGLEVTYDESN